MRLPRPQRRASQAFDTYVKMIASKQAVPSLLDLHALTQTLHASRVEQSHRMNARSQRRSAAVDFTMKYAASTQEIGRCVGQKCENLLMSLACRRRSPRGSL